MSREDDLLATLAGQQEQNKALGKQIRDLHERYGALLGAAQVWRKNVASTGPISADLAKAVDALEGAKVEPALCEVGTEIMIRSVRAYSVFMRELRFMTDDPLKYGWPVMTTAAEFAALDAWRIDDVRFAGPKTWRVWCEALESLGLDVAWKSIIGDDE